MGVETGTGTGVGVESIWGCGAMGVWLVRSWKLEPERGGFGVWFGGHQLFLVSIWVKVVFTVYRLCPPSFLALSFLSNPDDIF